MYGIKMVYLDPANVENDKILSDYTIKDLKSILTV